MGLLLRRWRGADGEEQNSEARLEIAGCKTEDEVGDGCGVKQPKQHSHAQVAGRAQYRQGVRGQGSSAV